MTHNTLVSIVLTTLNCAAYLREAMDSCLNQTYRDLELIVVDGGSTDGTLEITTSYADPRVRLIHQPGNSGKLPGALNLGLENTNGEYLTWMQGDSTYAPTAIAEMVEALDAHPEVGQVYADFWEVNEFDHQTTSISLHEPEQFLGDIGDPAGVCFMIRRQVREAVGLHDLKAYPSQDYDYRMRIAMRFQSYHIKHPLYYWRVHPNSLTGQLTWVRLTHVDIEIRRRLGLSNASEARRWHAKVDMAYAFECFKAGKLKSIPALVISSLWRDPRFITNRGVWSILARSLPSALAVHATGRRHA